MPRRLVGGARVDRIPPQVADLHRHPPVPQPLDDHGRAPGPVGLATALHLLQAIVDQRRAVQPLSEQPTEVPPRHLLAHGAEGALVHMLELPAGVVSPEPPSITIIGNSVPPPSMRCTLVSCGQANGPYSESSQASAVTVRWTAIPFPQVWRSCG